MNMYVLLLYGILEPMPVCYSRTVKATRHWRYLVQFILNFTAYERLTEESCCVCKNHAVCVAYKELWDAWKYLVFQIIQ